MQRKRFTGKAPARACIMLLSLTLLHNTAYAQDAGMQGTEQRADGGGAMSDGTDYYSRYGTPHEPGAGQDARHEGAGDGFAVESVHTDIRISEDRIFHVEKSICVWYDAAGTHPDISVSIPLYGSGKSGTDRVENISVSSDIQECGFASSRGTGSVSVTLMDSHPGRHYTQYMLSYDYIGAGDDDMSCDIIAQDIGLSGIPYVQSVSFSMSFPSAFEQKGIVFSDSNGNDPGMFHSTDDGMISGYCRDTVPGGCIRMDLTVQDGYFNDAGKGPYDIVIAVPLVFAVLSVAAGFALAAAVFLQRGRSGRIKPVRCVRPPDGISPVYTAAVLNGAVTESDLMLYLPHLAAQGYISISDAGCAGQRKRDPYRGYTFAKKREYDGKDRYAAAFMRILFPGMAHDADPERLHASMNRLSGLCEGMRMEAMSGLWETDEPRAGLCRSAGVFVPLLMSLALTLYGLGAGTGLRMLSFLYGPAISFGIYAVMKRADRYMKKRNVAKGGVSDIMAWIYVITACLMMLIVSDGINHALFLSRHGYMTASLVCEVTLLLCAYNMERRTRACAALCGRLSGFRAFLAGMDESSMEHAVSEDGQYAYRMLPYVAVFGMSHSGWFSLADAACRSEPDWFVSGHEFRCVDFMRDMERMTEKIVEKDGA